jgi:hypothetical protein
MKRTAPWAAVAFFPLAALLAVTVFESASSAPLSGIAAGSGVDAFLLTYWWAVLFAFIIVPLAWFLVAALRNRALPTWLRIAWSVAMVLFGPVAAPAYWWVHSARRE